MKILHYSLGFPPYRTGGLTKFCMDLMIQQVSEGNDVSLLWPGEIKILSKKIRIKSGSSIERIKNYEIINPIPVSYDEGIKDISTFTNKGEKKVYSNFLREICPDVIHIHTLMGLHSSFLDASKELGIKTVYSTHDFFPICPKVTMFKNNEICNCIADCLYCLSCNEKSLSYKKMVLLQSKLYRNIKDSRIMKMLRNQHRNQVLSSDNFVEDKKGGNQEYFKLRNYYHDILRKIDIIHFNSSLTKSVYQRFFSDVDGIVIPITHSSIGNNIKKKAFTSQLKITYLGPAGGGKGFYLLKAALDEIAKKRDLILNVFFKLEGLPQYIKQHEKYTYDQLENIFDETDVLVVPSIWYETFGFTVIEALSYGVPVIVSSNVGAKDIIPDGCGMVFQANNLSCIQKTISMLNREYLKKMNRQIIESYKVVSMASFSKEIIDWCYEKNM